jgi:hypothetical protein
MNMDDQVRLQVWSQVVNQAHLPVQDLVGYHVRTQV